MDEKIVKIIKITKKTSKSNEYPALFFILPKNHPITSYEKVMITIFKDKIEIVPYKGEKIKDEQH